MTTGSAPKKKGLSTLAWVAIGCGGLLVVGLVIFLMLGMFVFNKGKEMVQEATGSESFEDFVEDMKANPTRMTAETMIRMNPELELIETDDAAGTITFRNKTTGEEATLDFADIAEGRFSVTTEEGEYTVGAASDGEGGMTFEGPEGETRIGASADLGNVPDWVPRYPGATDLTSVYHSTSAAGGVLGALSGNTSDQPQEVIDHFKKLFEDEGWEVGGETLTKTGGAAFGGVTGSRNGRTLNVGVTRQDDQTQVVVNYSQEGT